MDGRTKSFLRTAQSNFDFAQAIISQQFQPASLNWGVVVAFYSAVHFVNACLWEFYQLEPHNHTERTNAVHRMIPLNAVSTEYDMLRDWAYEARYNPSFRVSNQRAQLAMQYLEKIASIVFNTLPP